MKNKTVLVTGGAGFIGSHLVDCLVTHGANVRVLDNMSNGSYTNPKAETIVGDIRDLGKCKEMCAGVDVVFHQAALGSVPRSFVAPAETIDVNVTGTANVFQAASEAGCKRIVYASSSSVYGDDSHGLKTVGFEGTPLSIYAESKVTCEALADAFSRCFGGTFVGLRYFNVFGPRQRADCDYAAVVPRFIEATKTHAQLVVNGSGMQMRDFTYVDDVVNANILAAKAFFNEEGEGSFVANVGRGHATTINSLAENVLKVFGFGSISRIEHAKPRPGDVEMSCAETEGAREQIGFSAKVSLLEGLRKIKTFA